MNALLHFHTMLPDSETPPEWIHLLPAGVFRGADGRGPYRLENPDALIRHSMEIEHGKILLDENHITDHAAKHGGSAPAMAWIVELQSRADGIWGRADWTKAGDDVWEKKSYRGLSPAFATNTDGVVTRIARASLTNLPNLTLTHLHTQSENAGMNPDDIARLLGLPQGSTESDIRAALGRAGSALTLHSQVTELTGLPASTSTDALVTGLRAKQETVSTHAQQQIDGLKKQLGEVRERASQAWLETAGKRKVISEDLGKELLTLHSQNPDTAEMIVNGLVDVPKNVTMHSRGASKIQPTAGSGGVASDLSSAMDDALGLTEKK